MTAALTGDRVLPPFVKNHQAVRFSDKNKSEAIALLDESDYGQQQMLDSLKNGGYSSEEDHVVANIGDGEAITSWDVVAQDHSARSEFDYTRREQMHRAVLDIDIPAVLIPSTTPGHAHLYIDKLMPWSKYSALLLALAEAGIIERGFANASLVRGYSAVRLPWVEKPAPPEPVLTSFWDDREVFA